LSRDRLTSWILGVRSECSRISLDLERGADDRPFLVVSHELRYGVSSPWRRRRAVALSLAEGAALAVLVKPALSFADSESNPKERKSS